MRFLPYEPDQAWLLPPSVKDVLGEDQWLYVYALQVTAWRLERRAEKRKGARRMDPPSRHPSRQVENRCARTITCPNGSPSTFPLQLPHRLLGEREEEEAQTPVGTPGL
jgi:hypothetical protein